MRNVSQLAPLLLILGAACSHSPTTITLPQATPEEAYRSFMIANLSGDRATIEPLILEHPDAAILWQGPYPAQVAKALSAQYESMEITRVAAPSINPIHDVWLRSSAVPVPVQVSEISGVWKVNAGPLIELRKAAQATK